MEEQGHVLDGMEGLEGWKNKSALLMKNAHCGEGQDVYCDAKHDSDRNDTIKGDAGQTIQPSNSYHLSP